MLTKTKPHVYQPTRKGSACSICGGWADASYHNLELFTDADREREAMRQRYDAEQMTRTTRQPLKDISKAAGIIERESPLFFGSGCNPSLF